MATLTKGILLSEWSNLTESKKASLASSFLQQVQDPTLQQLEGQYQSVSNEINSLSANCVQPYCSSPSSKNMPASMIVKELMAIKDSIHEQIQARLKCCEYSKRHDVPL